MVLFDITKKDKHYEGKYKLGKFCFFTSASLGYQDSMYPYSRSGFDYNNRYDPYDNNRYNYMGSRGSMYDNDRMYRGGSMYNNYNDYNSRYNGRYNNRYNGRYNSRYNNYNNYNDYNDYNRRYDSMSGGYPVFGSQTSSVF